MDASSISVSLPESSSSAFWGESGRVLATLAAGSVGASPSSDCVDV